MGLCRISNHAAFCFKGIEMETNILYQRGFFQVNNMGSNETDRIQNCRLLPNSQTSCLGFLYTQSLLSLLLIIARYLLRPITLWIVGLELECKKDSIALIRCQTN